MFEALIGVVTFDILELEIFESLKEGRGFSFTPTFPFNQRFETLGYGSQNTFENFGSINIVLFTLCL